ncbi:hypothetical protein VP01_2077g5 [Puccinia sorghi]|uniref:Uncharacterized protein n=1 Tax=Puccinia sorghi TaxID=27349 RepID=A0A0L6VB26_9BASI|nr:hypothetical protein VP01_2077g5 [Puccinia sorghi]
MMASKQHHVFLGEGKFHLAENEHISQSWIKVSTKELINNSQKKDEFWNQINQFNQYAGIGREARSLSNR